MSVDGFDLERLMRVLAEHGVAMPDAASGRGGGPMQARVRLRGPEAGGAKEGTPELYVAGPDGLEVQLQDTTYCGGAGTLGNVCGAVEPPPSKGLLAVRDLNHFTMFTSDGARSNAFYQGLFGLRVQAYQAATPALGVGPGAQFIMFAGRGAAAAPSTPRAARIDHVCVSLDGFDTGTIVKTLESNGIRPRAPAPGSAGPLVWYITMRMPDRGGAPGGTPELYFTDPDGIAIQIQDTTYCGGAGSLGDVCS
jgi:catechol 2,3-dioxygenase-like lactoylglutathione lyase family enzyme